MKDNSLDLEECLNELAECLEIKTPDTSKYRVNEYFKLAHVLYLKIVRGLRFDYELYVGWFFVLFDEMVNRNILPNDLNHNGALVLVRYIMTNKEEKTKDYFDKMPIGDYTSLINSASKQHKPEIDQASESSLADDKDYATDYPAFSENNENDGDKEQSINYSNTLMLSPMSKLEIKMLTDFANSIQLFNEGNLTIKEMTNFLNCNGAIKTRNNNQAALLFLLLANKSFIKNKWASIISGRHLLIGSTGNHIKVAHNLTDAASREFKKRPDAHNGETKAIIDFVDMLSIQRRKISYERQS